jgi:NOP9-like PUF repeat domain
MRDPTSSHLLEVLALCAPPRVFQSIWTTYFVGRLPKLVTHPVANFVVAKAVERLEAEEDLRTVWLEMGGVTGGGWDKIISELLADSTTIHVGLWAIDDTTLALLGMQNLDVLACCEP